MAKRADLSSTNASNGTTVRRSERNKPKSAAEKTASLPMRERTHSKKKKPDAAIAKLIKLRKDKPYPQRYGRVAQAMQGAGFAAKVMIEKAGIAKADPLVTELAKLASRDPAALGYDYQAAISARANRVNPYMHQEYSIEYRRQLHAGERVLRVWVPFEPNELEHVENETYIRTKWNASCAQIVRMVEDQFEITDEMYAKASWGDMMSDKQKRLEKQSHITYALRLKGVEIVEYHARGEYEQMEVFFEEPEAKVGMHLR